MTEVKDLDAKTLEYIHNLLSDKIHEYWCQKDEAKTEAEREMYEHKIDTIGDVCYELVDLQQEVYQYQKQQGK